MHSSGATVGCIPPRMIKALLIFLIPLINCLTKMKSKVPKVKPIISGLNFFKKMGYIWID
jgi:hypothetical protein